MEVSLVAVPMDSNSADPEINVPEPSIFFPRLRLINDMSLPRAKLMYGFLIGL